MLRHLAKLAAWAALAAIVLLSLLPPGTILAEPANFSDRAFRYAVLSLLWVVAYPRGLLAVSLLIGCVAVGSEALQWILPGRSGTIVHLLTKLAGTSAGIVVGVLGLMLVGMWRGREK